LSKGKAAYTLPQVAGHRVSRLHAVPRLVRENALTVRLSSRRSLREGEQLRAGAS